MISYILKPNSLGYMVLIKRRNGDLIAKSQPIVDPDLLASLYINAITHTDYVLLWLANVGSNRFDNIIATS